VSQLHFCDISWHDGDTVDADYMIRPDQHEPHFPGQGFACCAVHVDRALSQMLDQFQQVIVFSVNRAGEP